MIELQLREGQNREAALAEYLGRLDTELDYEANRRLNGDNVYVGYKTLRDFYKGKQWSFKAVENQTQRMYNYCFVVVESMTAFMAGEEPDNTHEPRDVTDEMQAVLSEQVTKLLKLIHDQNRFHIQFQRGVRVASSTGDCFILGPFWDASEKRITYRVVERPELVRPIWATDDFTRLVGYIVEYRMDRNQAKRMFADEMKRLGIEDFQTDTVLQAGELNGETQTRQQMVTVREFWDDSEHLTRINNQPIKYWKHDFDFVPCQYIPNIHLPGETKGTSDLENLLDPQQEYNLSASSEKDIIDAVGFPLLWGKELEGMSEIKTGRGTVFSLPEDGELGAIQPSGSPTIVDGYSGRRKTDIISIARLNDVVVSGGNVTQLSGRAMAVLMQGINNSVALRKPFWKNAIEELNANILRLAEKYVPGAKELIQGNYRTTTFIPSAYMRSITDELNKMTHKIQSQRTTMKNVGIPSPSEEQKLIKTELEDPMLNTELSRQPGGYITVQQQQEAAAAPPQPQPAAAPGGGPPTTLTEGQNQGGEMPSPVPGQGAIATPAGAVNQGTQQMTGAPVMMEGEEL